MVVDGTALTLADWKRHKDFGAIGATNLGARGLKVINAYAISSTGTPIGLLGQQWWKREARKKRRDCQHRVVADKETRQSLVSQKVIVNLISATTTTKGLAVRSCVDPGTYAKGRRVSDQFRGTSFEGP